MPRTTNFIRDIATPTLLGAASMSNQYAAQKQVVAPTTTGVLVILTAKSGVTREQVMAVMPAEFRATVQLYVNGKIRARGSRVPMAVEQCSCSMPRMLTRQRQSWTPCHWQSKTSWTTNT